MQKIKSVEDEDCQVLLEKRYIFLDDWTEIAEPMHVDLRTVYRIHGKALNMAQVS